MNSNLLGSIYWLEDTRYMNKTNYRLTKRGYKVDAIDWEKIEEVFTDHISIDEGAKHINNRLNTPRNFKYPYE